MKKEYKYLILVLVIMFGFQFSVLADTITDDGNWHDVAGISNNNGLDCSCNSDAVTCET